MKIILLKDVKQLGKAGDLVDAKAGYARNYLIPRELAVEATEENKENWEEEMKIKEEKREEEKQAALELKEKIEASKVELKGKGGEGGRLFGSVTSKDIADGLKEQFGIKLDRRKIELKDNIKELGETEVEVRVYPEITANLKVEVVAE